MGLLMNGLVKVPLQFSILLIGALLFSFYMFYQAPAFFNLSQEKMVKNSPYIKEYEEAEKTYRFLQDHKTSTAVELAGAIEANDKKRIDDLRIQIQEQENKTREIRDNIKSIVKKASPGSDTNDTNYIFLRFVGDYLPAGLVGLIIAIIFLAAWGSIAAALNSLASCTMVDFHLKFSRKPMSPDREYKWSKFYSFLWGVFCVIIAQFAYNLGNSLIEAVNILGSWFYGTILGIFLVAFYVKKIKAHAVFYAAILAEILVISVYFMDIISFLWLNVIGAIAVPLFAWVLQIIINKRSRPSTIRSLERDQE